MLRSAQFVLLATVLGIGLLPAAAFAHGTVEAARGPAPGHSAVRVVAGPKGWTAPHVRKGEHLGLRPRHVAVIGGADAGGNYLYLVVIRLTTSSGGGTCSGSKISPRTIPTARRSRSSALGLVAGGTRALGT